MVPRYYIVGEKVGINDERSQGIGISRLRRQRFKVQGPINAMSTEDSSSAIQPSAVALR